MRNFVEIAKYYYNPNRVIGEDKRKLPKTLTRQLKKH